MKNLTNLLFVISLIIVISVINGCKKEPVLPTLTTTGVSEITLVTAKSGGYISNDGDAAITARGVCYSTTQNPTTSNNPSTNGTGKGSFASNLTGLLPGTTYYVRAYATNSVGTAYGNNVTFITSPVVVPALTTTAVSAITLTTATSGGNISNDGGADVTVRGICWSTTQNPTTANNPTTNGTGTGIFVSNLAGLLPGTTYYVRAYATNSAGTGYGNQVTFNTTAVLVPVLTTTAVTNITLTTATSGGNITNDGGSAVTARGVCWSTTQNPTTANSLTTNATGTGIFVSNLTGLLPGTTYYVRAYATNSAGTAYGNQVTFNTSAILVPVLTTTAVTGITLSTAISGGNITNNGGSTITASGICWSTTQDPTTANNLTTDGTVTGSFVSNMTGLTPGTTYYVRAYATNSGGTAYGNQVTFTTLPVVVPTLTTAAVTGITVSTAISGGNITNNGGGAITASGICWSTSQDPTTANNLTTDGTATGSFVSNMTGLTPGTTYYVRAYATNSAGTAYGNQVTFNTTTVVMPTLTTAAVTGITVSTAISGGNITNNGGSNITASGICWNTSQDPTTANNLTTDGTATGIFVSSMTGLTTGTIYYVRAYATNSAGTAYGNQLSFVTSLADIEGNVYKAVAIGTQIWMAENLKATKYNTNADIPNVPDATTWNSLSTPACSWYDNDILNKDKYGVIYNWFTVATGNLCPAGWHEPTDAEYNTLEVYLGVPLANVNDYGWRGTDQGTRMKSTTGWDAGGNGTNTSGFNALAGGYLQWLQGQFFGLGTLGYFWSATDDAINGNPNVAWYRQLDSAEPRISKMTTNKTGGKYVRCVKD